MIKRFARLLGSFPAILPRVPPSAAVVFAAGLLTLASSANATVVPPGGFALPISAATVPQGDLLAEHTTVEDVRNPFINLTFFHAHLTTRVIREESDTISFVYQLSSDALSESLTKQGIAFWNISGFKGYTVDAAFVNNGGFTPIYITRSTDGDRLQFHGYPDDYLLIGQPAATLIVRTSAQDFRLFSNTFIMFDDFLTGEEPPIPGQASFVSAAPIPVPEPRTLLLSLPFLLRMFFRQRRS